MMNTLIMLLIVTVILIPIVMTDIIPLYKNKQWKRLDAYAISMALLYVLIILLSFDVKIPSPADFISKIIKSLFPIE